MLERRKRGHARTSEETATMETDQMMTRAMAFCIMLAFTAGGLAGLSWAAEPEGGGGGGGTVIEVDPGGGGDYTSIQDAIDNASQGDTIRVHAGTYYENVVVNRSVVIIGNGTANTTVDGGGWGDVLKVKVDRVNISGLSVTGSGGGPSDAAIHVIGADNVTIEAVNCSGNDGNGIHVEGARHTSVVETVLGSNGRAGIRLSSGTLHTRVLTSVVTDNQDGVVADGSDGNEIMNNTISYNLGTGLWFISSDGSILFYNNIISNFLQVNDTGDNLWNNSAGEGSYWDDYKGADNGAGGRPAGDGIGDTGLPHGGVDAYPFLREDGWLYPGTPNLTVQDQPDPVGNFTLEWTVPARSTGYELQEAGEPQFISPETIYAGSQPFWSIDHHEEGLFYYRVRGTNDLNPGPWSGYADVAIDYPPYSPDGLEVVPYAYGNALNISWTPNEYDVREYLLRYRTKGLGTWEDLAVIDHPDCSFDHTGLWDGVTYQYRVHAIDALDQLSGSSVIAEGVPADTMPPEPPVNLRVVNGSEHHITLEWDSSPTSDAASYHIYRSAEPDGGYVRVTDVPIADLHLIDTGLAEGTTFYYRATALDEVPNESAFSATAAGTTLLGPAPPVILGPREDVVIAEDTSDDSQLNLHDWFADPNGDPLTFTLSGNGYLTVTIYQDNGTVVLRPAADWNGEETLTFFASDGIFKVYDTVKVIVTGVNDPPEEVYIREPEDGSVFYTEDEIGFSVHVRDPDIFYGDKLRYRWSSNVSGDLGKLEVLQPIPLSAGHHRITVTVTDGAGESGSDHVDIEIKARDDGPGPDEPQDPDGTQVDITDVLGVSVLPVQDVFIQQGSVLGFDISVQNTGIYSDGYAISIDAGALADHVTIDDGTVLYLGPGERLPLRLLVAIPSDLPAGAYPVSLTVRSLVGVEHGAEITGTVGFTVTVNERPVIGSIQPSHGDSPGGFGLSSQQKIVLAASVTGVVAGAIAATSPLWTLALMFLMAPLMVKWSKKEEDRKWRDRIYGAIVSKPGVHFTALKGWLEIANGTLIYNLEMLIAEGRIRSERDGFFKRYYPTERDLDRKPLPLMNMEDKIALVVRDNPGAAQSEIAHLLDESRQVIHYHVKKMQEKGVIYMVKAENGHTSIYLTEEKDAEGIRPGAREKVAGSTQVQEEGGSGPQVANGGGGGAAP